MSFPSHILLKNRSLQYYMFLGNGYNITIEVRKNNKKIAFKVIYFFYSRKFELRASIQKFCYYEN